MLAFVTENVKKTLDGGMNYVINCDATTIRGYRQFPTAFEVHSS